MIISSSLTVGQTTFILRVTIQILAYVGMFIVNVLILGHLPRVTSLATHDLLNRVVGSANTTISTIKWTCSRLNRNSANPSLIIILFLSVSYAAFVSLSDIGFIGFNSCSTPGSSFYTTPASIDTAEKAAALIATNLVDGSNPSLVKSFQCDSTSNVPLEIGGTFFHNCTSWRNGTYGDSTAFSGLNSTDTAALMPKQITSTIDFPHFNSFYFGPTNQRLKDSVIVNGLAVVPHEAGVIGIVGVPQLGNDTKIKLSKTLAIELDVGCMTLGVTASDSEWTGDSDQREYFHTNDSWREYTGPEYMKDILHETVDDIRAYLQPFFNSSTINSDGLILSINATAAGVLWPAAIVSLHTLPENSTDTDDVSSVLLNKMFMGNCTEAFVRQLGPFIGRKLQDESDRGTMCSLLGISGTHSVDGEPFSVYQRMVCAASTQVNMVAATVEVDAHGGVTSNVSRLPSDLIHMQAYSQGFLRGSERYERYTLSDNINSPTTHLVRHIAPLIIHDDYQGLGTAANAISYMGHIVLSASALSLGELNEVNHAGLALLDEGFDHVALGPSDLTRWLGQVAGSYILGSLSYNGWVALQATPIEVISTGGHAATCYNPIYALGFLPLISSAAVIMCWAILLFLRGRWSGYGAVKAAYGGISPYTVVTCPEASMKDTLAAWESSPHPHLELVSKGTPLVGESGDTALKYLKASVSYINN